MERYRFSEQEQSFLEGLQTPLAVFQLVDQRVITLALSDGFWKLMGADSREQAYAAMNGNTLSGVHPDDAARVGNTVARFMREGGTFESIYRLKRSSGDRVIHAMGHHVYTQSGVRLAQIWYMDEGDYAEKGTGTELNQSLTNALHEESILKANFYDDLTGLPNLTYFFDLAEMEKVALRRKNETPVILYIDLNGMKYFNYKYSFAEGDKLLQGLAKLLTEKFGADHCGHVGADRFAVCTQEAGLEDRLNRLFEDAALLNDGKSLPVRAGIYSSRIEDVPVSYAYDRAKIACDAVKKSDFSGFNYYSEELRDYVRKSQYIITNIDRAIAEKWIQVYYQPIVRAVNERVCDVEALARWIDPVEGFLSPADFIPFLEDGGLIYKLDLFVLEQVLEKIKSQAAEGIRTVPHSINLSRSDFDMCDIVEEIRRRVDASGVDRERITIEITESVIGKDFEFMKKQVERFQKLGFPVWMDDFGSGYSSLEVLQSIRFDLLKFDMGFMRRLNEGENGRIILGELLKMATLMGVETICEGVETAEQVRFLQEVGCSKLQGFYYSKPVSMEEIRDRQVQKHPLLPENHRESAYFESLGRVNLYDLAMIANTEDNAFQNSFNTLPMGIVEIRGDQARFVRSNRSYRAFVKRFFGLDLSSEATFNKFNSSFMSNVVKTCCERGVRSFYDEKMPDGSIVHSFARRIDTNPVTGDVAVAIAVLSISEPDEGASYAEIARALAADYYNIYVVDLDTDRFIEYSSPVGQEEMAMERHGEDFFEAVRQAAYRICPEDRGPFFEAFSREKIVRALDEQGVFTMTYRLVDTGTPVYVNMKVTRMQEAGNRIIMGISVIDAQMKERMRTEEMQKEKDTMTRVMALTDGYLTLYTVDPDTDHYVEYTATSEYESLGFAKEGRDFFLRGRLDGERTVYPEDVPGYLERFTKENVLGEIREKGVYRLNYRLVIHGEPKHVTLKIAPFKEGEKEKLLVGVREWVKRAGKH